MTTYHPPAHYAEVWDVDADAVRLWCATGELKAVNVAKRANAKKPRWRISETAAAEFMERRTRGQAAPATPRRAARKSSAATIKFY
ncbi:MAG: hypothetical protein Q8K78_09085 [Planctomycetaceae bacterium]|nr:hypothetical protein [Planctomycetaceae bacterium]